MIFRLFRKRDNGQAEANKARTEGYDAFQRGKQHYLVGSAQAQEALDCFDTAIGCGFEDGGIYGMRGWALQVLGFDPDAISDFSKGITLEPEDSNLYFMRSLSRGGIGDLHGAVEDLEEAIRLSEIDNALNATYNVWAKQHGYDSITTKYQYDLRNANCALEQQADEEISRSKCPGLDLGPDLVSRRRVTARRRAHHERGA